MEQYYNKKYVKYLNKCLNLQKQISNSNTTDNKFVDFDSVIGGVGGIGIVDGVDDVIDVIGVDDVIIDVDDGVDDVIGVIDDGVDTYKKINITTQQNLYSLKSYIEKSNQIKHELNSLKNSEPQSKPEQKSLLGGGITANNPRDVFLEYLSKGKISLLTYDSYNSSKKNEYLLVSIDGSKGETHPDLSFYGLDTTSVLDNNTKIKNLCVKMVLTTISSTMETRDFDLRFLLRRNVEYAYVKTASDIIKEIVLQNLAVSATNKYFEPVSPYILYADILKNSEAINFLAAFDNFDIGTNITEFVNIRHLVSDLTTTLERNEDLCLSFIVSELKPLHYFKDEIYYAHLEEMHSLKFYEIIRSVMYSRILPMDVKQDDFKKIQSHKYIENVNYRYYIMNYNRAYVINDIEYNTFMEMILEQNYYLALKTLYLGVIEKLSYDKNHFSFILKNVYPEIDKYIHKIFKLREKKINKLFRKNSYTKRLSDNIEIINKYWMFNMINVIVEEKPDFNMIFTNVVFDIGTQDDLLHKDFKIIGTFKSIVEKFATSVSVDDDSLVNLDITLTKNKKDIYDTISNTIQTLNELFVNNPRITRASALALAPARVEARATIARAVDRDRVRAQDRVRAHTEAEDRARVIAEDRTRTIAYRYIIFLISIVTFIIIVNDKK